MVGTTTTSTARTPAASLAGRVAQAAMLAAQVAQKVDKPSYVPEPYEGKRTFHAIINTYIHISDRIYEL